MFRNSKNASLNFLQLEQSNHVHGNLAQDSWTTCTTRTGKNTCCMWHACNNHCFWYDCGWIWKFMSDKPNKTYHAQICHIISSFCFFVCCFSRRPWSLSLPPPKTHTQCLEDPYKGRHLQAVPMPSTPKTSGKTPPPFGRFGFLGLGTRFFGNSVLIQCLLKHRWIG